MKRNKLPPKPRDLGLLLNVLVYRVPPDRPMTEQWIETARSHCRMKPERLAELRTPGYQRLWDRMLARRAARLAYSRQHGNLPAPGTPLLPGERDRSASVRGMRQYWKIIRPVQAKIARGRLSELVRTYIRLDEQLSIVSRRRG